MPLNDTLRNRSPRARRDERDELGFLRQPEVRWLSPGLLLRSGVEVLVSGAFGRFADKRDIQDERQDPLEYSAPGDLWVDYLSDTGDGFDATYTMAWLLSRPDLDAGGERLPRGRVLLLGGDQVYPSADPEAYEDRFIGPFRAAFPRSGAPDEQRPDLYALPGNHDWYDGLASFLRVFCRRAGEVGEWRTRQRRSYFSLRLPNGWWIWAIDIQLDTYIDEAQLDYFRSQPVRAGDKVVLLTAKPSWVKAYPGRLEPASWRYLSFFEQRIVRPTGARLAVVLTGDLHHYARYEPRGDGADDAPTRITAGGGGAYLSPTHTLKRTLEVQALDAPRSVTYAREEIYPRAAVSSRLGNGIFKLALLNPSFARLLGWVYVLLGVGMLGALTGGDGSLLAFGRDADFLEFAGGAAGGMTLLLAAVLFGGLYGGTDIVAAPLEPKGWVVRATKLARLGVALAHALLHLLLAALVVYAVLTLDLGAGLAVWLVSVAALFVAGTLIGATVFGLFLWLVHRVRGEQAPEAANQVFTGQSIADHKNLLRMRFGADGRLTIYALGVDRVGRRWRYAGRDAPGERFVPADGEPAAALVDEPLRFDAAGRREY